MSMVGADRAASNAVANPSVSTTAAKTNARSVLNVCAGAYHVCAGAYQTFFPCSSCAAHPSVACDISGVQWQRSWASGGGGVS